MIFAVKNSVEIDDKLRVSVLAVLGVCLGAKTLAASIGRVESSASWHDHCLSAICLTAEWVL